MRPARRVAAASAVAAVLVVAWLASGRAVDLGELATAEGEPEPSPAPAYNVEHLGLRTTTGRSLSCIVRVPARPSADEQFPVLLVAGGRRTGRAAALSVDTSFAGIVLSCDYPWRDPARLSWPAFLLRLPRIRAELLATPQALGIATTYLLTRPEADSSRLVVLGASLGVPPVAAWAATDPRPRAVALLYGGGPLGAVLEANLGERVRWEWMRSAVASGLGRALRPLEPTLTVGRIAPRPVLVVGAADDQWIPADAVLALYAAAREPKRLLWFGGEHVRTSDSELLRALTDSVAAWAEAVGATAPRRTTVRQPPRPFVGPVLPRAYCSYCMEYLWKVPLAVIGLLLIRGVLYPRRWGHGSVLDALLLVVGLGLTMPLVTEGRPGVVLLGVLTVVALLPYRAMAERVMRSKVLDGARRIAARWGTSLREDRETGLWDVTAERDGRKVRVGNVLVHVRSLHPGVGKKRTGYLLAYVAELRSVPPFLCSLMRGWNAPQYFEREWRSTHQMQGDFLGISWDGLLDEESKGRETGGKVADLSPYQGLGDPRFAAVTAIGTRREEFERVFSGELLDEFFATAAPSELDVTPSSVSILGGYAGFETQQRCAAFVERLASRLEQPAAA